MNPLIIKRIDFDPHFEPLVAHNKVISHRVITAVEKERQILKRAHEEARLIHQKAEEILAQAEQDFESERQRGYEEGREEALQEYSEKLIELGIEKEKILKESEPQIIRMIMDIAEKVIGRELESGAIVDVVEKTIRESVGKKVVVHLHPDDLKLVKEKQSQLLPALAQSASLAFREDETVSAGGCIVETELGTVDARLEIQLEAIRKALGLNEDAGLIDDPVEEL